MKLNQIHDDVLAQFKGSTKVRKTLLDLREVMCPKYAASTLYDALVDLEIDHYVRCYIYKGRRYYRIMKS